MERATVFVRGRVQRVGFRWWVRARALELGLVGSAANLEDGRVQIVAQGSGEAIDALVALIQEEPSRTVRPGEVAGVVTHWGLARPGVVGFREK